MARPIATANSTRTKYQNLVRPTRPFRSKKWFVTVSTKLSQSLLKSIDPLPLVQLRAWIVPPQQRRLFRGSPTPDRRRHRHGKERLPLLVSQANRLYARGRDDEPGFHRRRRRHDGA